MANKIDCYTTRAIYFDPKSDDLTGDPKKHASGQKVSLSATQFEHFRRNGAVTKDEPLEASNGGA